MSSIVTLKDTAPVTYEPLLLAEVQFVDGTLAYFSTAPLNSAEGGYAYGGHNYLARIDRQDLAALAARSVQGIDRYPSATIRLHDSDGTLFNAYDTPAGKGWFGAILTLRLVFWNADTSTFSDDSYVQFIGICDPPQREQNGQAEVIVLNANASHNLARVNFPPFHVQQRCGNVFPLNAAERLGGATNMSHKCWGCGYDPDQAGTDPEIGGSAERGNTGAPNQYDAYGRQITDASGIYILCNYTKTDCVTRGMYTVDSAARATGRFTGDQWMPPDRELQSKSYILGKTIPVLNMRNDAAYQESYPMVYGVQFVNPVTLNVPADADYTAGETIVCQDNIGVNVGSYALIQFVINGVIVPKTVDSPDKKLFRADLQTSGSRNGKTTDDTPWGDGIHVGSGQGDPHGSIATVVWKVYNQLAQPGAIPNIRAMIQGPTIKVPNTTNANNQASWPYEFTVNPAWILLDLLIWANFQYQEIELSTFIGTAASGSFAGTGAPYCDGVISYVDNSGNANTHARFKAQFALETRRTAQDVIQAILRSFNAQLTWSSTTGKLELLIRQTLADQQSTLPMGSNYSTPVASVHADGTAGNGYAAYHFDESVVIRRSEKDPPFIRRYSDAVANMPNRLTFPFQDEENSFALDSISMIDADAIARAGGYQTTEQEIVEQLNIIGISNFDQASRICNVLLAEKYRGNDQGDTRGTVYFDIPISFRGVTLKPGQICILSWQKYSMVKQTVRVTKIAPVMNWESAIVTVAWHEDEWYTDIYGQNGPPLTSNPNSGRPNRVPYPWQPYGTQPITNDSLFWVIAGYVSGSWLTFGISQQYSPQGDGTYKGELPITGNLPLNQMSQTVQPPLLAIQGTSATFGGVIPDGRTYFFVICAIDSDGLLSPPSKPFSVSTGTSGSATNTVTTPAISWASGSVGYVIFGGSDSNNLTQQGRDNGLTPSTITLAALAYEQAGVPDQLAYAVNFRGKRVIHGGCWGDKCTAVDSTSISFTPPSNFTVNAFAGYDLQLVARGKGDTSEILLANFRVSANTVGGKFTVTPNPVSSGIVVGDVFIMLFKPGTVTDTTIQDLNLINPYAPTGLDVDAEVGTELRTFIGTGGHQQLATVISNTATAWTIASPWSETPTSTTRFIECEAGFPYDLDTEKKQNRVLTTSPVPQCATIAIDNYAGKTLFIQANIMDSDGHSSLEAFAPWRMVYIWGQGLEERTVTADDTLLVDDAVLYVDSTSGPITIQLLPSSKYAVSPRFIQKVSADSNIVTVQAAPGETINGSATVVLNVQWDTTEIVPNAIA